MRGDRRHGLRAITGAVAALLLAVTGAAGASGEEVDVGLPEPCHDVALGLFDKPRLDLRLASGDGGERMLVQSEGRGRIILRVCLDLVADGMSSVSVAAHPPTADAGETGADVSHSASVCAEVDVLIEGPAEGGVSGYALLVADEKSSASGVRVGAGASVVASARIKVRQSLAGEERVSTAACVSSSDTQSLSWS